MPQYRFSWFRQMAPIARQAAFFGSNAGSWLISGRRRSQPRRPLQVISLLSPLLSVSPAGFCHVSLLPSFYIHSQYEYSHKTFSYKDDLRGGEYLINRIFSKRRNAPLSRIGDRSLVFEGAKTGIFEGAKHLKFCQFFITEPYCAWKINDWSNTHRCAICPNDNDCKTNDLVSLSVNFAGTKLIFWTSEWVH